MGSYFVLISTHQYGIIRRKFISDVFGKSSIITWNKQALKSFTYSSVKSPQPEKAPSGIDWILLNDMSLKILQTFCIVTVVKQTENKQPNKPHPEKWKNVCQFIDFKISSVHFSDNLLASGINLQCISLLNIPYKDSITALACRYRKVVYIKKEVKISLFLFLGGPCYCLST